MCFDICTINIRVSIRVRGLFFFDRRPVPFGGSRHLTLTRLPRHDRGPVPGGNRSAASCRCTVLRRALYHYATRSPLAMTLSRSQRDVKRSVFSKHQHLRDILKRSWSSSKCWIRQLWMVFLKKQCWLSRLKQTQSRDPENIDVAGENDAGPNLQPTQVHHHQPKISQFLQQFFRISGSLVPTVLGQSQLPLEPSGVLKLCFRLSERNQVWYHFLIIHLFHCCCNLGFGRLLPFFALHERWARRNCDLVGRVIQAPHCFFSVQRLLACARSFSTLVACCISVNFFFPSNAFMASARSSNTFNCMLQTRVN